MPQCRGQGYLQAGALGTITGVVIVVFNGSIRSTPILNRSNALDVQVVKFHEILNNEMVQAQIV
jgi:hypothetical protein